MFPCMLKLGGDKTTFANEAEHRWSDYGAFVVWSNIGSTLVVGVIMRLIACKFIIKFERYCTFILVIDISLFDFSLLFLPFQIVGLHLYIFPLPPRKRSIFFFVIKMFLDSGYMCLVFCYCIFWSLLICIFVCIWFCLVGL